jgi:hypothetical protein
MILTDCLIEQVTQGWQCRHIKFAGQANDENIVNQSGVAGQVHALNLSVVQGASKNVM